MNARITPPTAAEILSAGMAHLNARAITHDKPQGERSIPATVAMFNAGTGLSLTPEQGWFFMVCLKLVRSQQGEHNPDNYEDGASYFALMGEEAAASRTRTVSAPKAESEAHSQALLDVIAERHRQIDGEGWTLDHDDEHRRGELSSASAAYSLAAAQMTQGYKAKRAPACWPWARSWWKPSDVRRALVKAAALAIAAVEQLDRRKAREEACNQAFADHFEEVRQALFAPSVPVDVATLGCRTIVGADLRFDQTGRQDAIDQNGNTGEHYLPEGLTWETAPADAVALVAGGDARDTLYVWVPALEGYVRGRVAEAFGAKAVGSLLGCELDHPASVWRIVARRPEVAPA